MAPPAPWTLAATSLVWLAPPNGDAARALMPGVTGRPLAVTGAFVSYDETPVGPYDEVMGAIGLRHNRGVAGHIPFIAVDSEDSVRGGRDNWNLPKTLAAFTGHPLRSRSMTGTGEDWTVSATARPLGPALPARTAFKLLQPGKTTRSTARLRFRPALVTVRTSGTPAGWLRSGRYPGAVIEAFRSEFGAPE